MANGYLGKISAIVSANTADFQAKLNASAKDVQAFARTVQSNLTTASKEAARSFESIYTPLQKFERSLQAAASMKLSFKGFAGAIKDVDVLRQRLASMKDSQVSLAVRASGMKNITELREALVGLRAKDLDIVAKVGGIEKVRELRALSAEKRVDFTVNLIDSGLGRRLAEAKARVVELKTEVSSVKAGGAMPSGGIATLAAQYREATAEVTRLQEVGRQTIKTTLGVNVQKDADVDRILQAGERAEAIRLPVILDVLGEAAVKEAVTQTQRIRSVAEQINKPFGEAAQKLAAMTVEVQAGFLPAMKRSQSQIESLKSNIEKGVLPASAIAQQFDVVEKRAAAAAAAVNRLAEASSKIGSMKTGQELAFSNPRLSETLDRGVAVGNRAASLPATTIQANPRIAEMLGEIATLSNKAVAAYAGLQRRMMLGLPTDSAQKSADALQARLDALFTEFDTTYQIHVDAEAAKKQFADLTVASEKLRDQTNFVVTGRPQTLEQADARRASLNAEVSGLDRSQRQDIKPLLQDADAARALGDVDKVNDALDKIEAKVSKAKAYNVTFEKAKKDARDLNNDLRAIADSLGPPVGMDRLKESTQAADAAVEKLAAGLDKARLKADIGQLRVDLGAAESLPAGAAKDQAIADISTRAESITQDAGVVAGNADSVEKARARITSLNDAWAQAVRGLPETEAKADAFFTGIMADIGKLDLADRMSLDPIIGEIIALIQTGAGISTVTARMMELEAATNELASAGKVSAAIKKLSPTAARNDLEARLAAAKAAATSPIPLATPGESVDDIGRETELRGSLGKDLADSSRQIDVLKGGITSLKGQIDALPEGVRARFIPAIRDAENEFVRLATAPSAMPAAIDAARQRVQQLAADAARATQAMNFSQSFGGAGAAGLNLGLDQRALNGYNAQLRILQGAISRASSEARGPAVAAFDRLRTAVATAFDEGNIDSGIQRDRLAAIRTEAIAAAASVSRIRVGSLTRDVARAGDIGRAGFDKFGLAMNQAGYAIDDFMSSTGGLEFKLRAISNNITQMAFILGGTTGLWIGLGAVIAGQAAVALIKWYNNGRTAEDQTKALNEALARQKGLVEELAEAFKSLGDEMSRGTLSGGGQQAKDFADQVENIRKKGKESREGKVFDLDRDVQRERAQQNAYKKQLESETDIGRRVVIARQIEQSKAAEREAMDRVRDRPEPTGADVAGLIERAAVRMEESGRSQRPSDTEFPVATSIREAGAGLDIGDTPEAIRAQIRALSNATSAVSETSAQTFFGLPTEESATSNVAAAAFADMTERLTAKLEAAIEELAINVVAAARGPAEQIRQAQEDVAEAIRRGVPNAAAFQRELDANAKKLKDAYASLEDAQNESDLDKKQAKVDEAQKNVAAVEAEQNNIRTRSREMRLGRTFGGDRTTAALSSLEGNERFRNESARTSSYLAAVIDREIAARSELEAATAKGVDAEIRAAEAALDAAQKASEAAAAYAEATLAIEAALTRIRKVGESALQKSEQGADAAQKAFEENPLRAGGLENREAAERRLIDDRARVDSAQDDLDNRRLGVQFNPQMKKINEEQEAIVQRRQDLEAKDRTGNITPAEQAELDAARKREIELARQREHLARDLTKAEQAQLDAINNGIAAREKELEKSRQRAAEDPTFKRRMDAANQVIANSERQANEAQERYINNPTERNRKERDEADVRLRDDRARAQKLQDDLDNKRKEIEQNSPLLAAGNKRIAENDKRLAELAEKEASGGLTDDEKRERTRLQEDNQRFRRQNEGIIASGTREEQKAIDDEQIAQNQRDRALRGRDLGMTDQERFRKEFTEGAGADINARAKELRDKGEDPTAFLRQALANQMESVAPMLKGFQDERQNAALQGPSRAALNVSDVSTSQGASELTRLIRGDDSAKDVNLAELRKQTQKFDEVIDAIRAANPGVLL